MIFEITKQNTKTGKPLSAKDVASYARYCLSPKPGDEQYKNGERVAASEFNNLFPGIIEAGQEELIAENIASDLEQWAIDKRAGKKSAKYPYVLGSLSFHPDDRLTPEQAIQRTQEAIQQVMPGKRPAMLVCHTDTDHMHVHFVVSTVDEFGKNWQPAGRTYSAWELEAERQEIEYGYTRVQQRIACASQDKDREVQVKPPSSLEIQIMNRTGKATPKQEAKAVIDKILESKPGTITAFADLLEQVDGYQFLPAGFSGKCQGWSIRCPDGVAIKGSDFGKAYSFAGLAKNYGVHYDENNDSKAISSRRSRQENQQFGADFGVSQESADPGTMGASLDAVGDQHGEISGRVGAVNAGSESSAASVDGSAASPKPDGFSLERGETGSRQAELAASLDRGGSVSNNDSSLDNIRILADEQPANGQARKQSESDLRTVKKDRTADQIETLLASFHAAGIDHFEVGSMTPINSGRPDKPKQMTYTAEQLLKPETIRWLKRENMLGQDVYFRPVDVSMIGASGIVMLDDLNGQKLSRVKRELAPLAVIETSPGNWQAWVQIGKRQMNTQEATLFAKTLAEEYGADLAAADWRHYGRLPGFTNQKPKHNKNGKHPFCGLMSTGIARVTQAFEKIKGIVAERFAALQANDRAAEVEGYNWQKFDGSETAKAYMFGQQNLLKKYPEPNWSQLDFMVCKDLVKRGHKAEDIEQALLKHSPVDRKREPEDYARRTVTASVEAVEQERSLADRQHKNERTSSLPDIR